MLPIGVRGFQPIMKFLVQVVLLEMSATKLGLRKVSVLDSHRRYGNCATVPSGKPRHK